MGAWFAVSAHYIFREPIMEVMDNLIAAKETRYNYLFFMSTLFLFGTLSVQILNYETVKTFENPEEWRKMLAEKCGTDSLINAF